jgi:hypothetical protein
MVCGRQFQNRKGLGGHLSTLKDPAHEAQRALRKGPAVTHEALAQPLEDPSAPPQGPALEVPPRASPTSTVQAEAPAWLEPALAGAGLAACTLALLNLVKSHQAPHQQRPSQPPPIPARQPTRPPMGPPEPSWMQSPGIGIRATGGLRPVRREWWWL